MSGSAFDSVARSWHAGRVLRDAPHICTDRSPAGRRTMPSLTPTTGREVIELVRTADLADDDVLTAFVSQTTPLPSTASDTATSLVQSGILTPFQAKLILRGKYKGFRLGPYRILDQIGGGGMGQVFLAEHVR